MKAYYLAFELLPPDRRMFLFIPDVGNIACAGFKDFANLGDINSRFNKSDDKLRQMQEIVESLKKSEKVDNWLYLGEADIPDYLVRRIISIHDDYQKLGENFNHVMMGVEQLVFEQIKKKEV